MPTAALRPRSTTEIVDAAFQIYRAYFGPLLLCAAIAHLPSLLLQLTLGSAPGAFPTLATGGSIVLMLLGAVVAMVSYGLMSAVLTVCGSQAYLGETVDVSAAVRRAIPRIGAVIVVSIVVGIATGLGFLLLIIPGFIVIANYFAATPALVLENLGPSAALSRSAALAKGRKWHILLTFLLIGVIYMIGAFGLGIVAAIAHSVVVQTLLTSVFTILLYPLISLVVTLLYYDARVQSEGLDIELMTGALDPLAAPSAL